MVTLEDWRKVAVQRGLQVSSSWIGPQPSPDMLCLSEGEVIEISTGQVWAAKEDRPFTVRYLSPDDSEWGAMMAKLRQFIG